MVWVERRTHGDIVQPVKVWQGLNVCLVFDQFLRPAVKEANMLDIT
jgi:hypothetical protein